MLHVVETLDVLNTVFCCWFYFSVILKKDTLIARQVGTLDLLKSRLPTYSETRSWILENLSVSWL